MPDAGMVPLITSELHSPTSSQIHSWDLSSSWALYNLCNW